MTQQHSDSRKRYAVVGTGERVIMFTDPIASVYREIAQLVGLCDPSETRRLYHQKRLEDQFGIDSIPVYADFDRMLHEQRPDVVIVCTVDAWHHHYIIRALEAGCDVITEKPVTTDEIKCQNILDAVRRSGRAVKVTFNLRWLPAATRIKELLLEGAIGTVKKVVFEYMLDTAHGADYFRRWHSTKENSGGLLVHKSTHHFDLVNWWLDSIPHSVFAFGDLAFYGAENAIRRGEGHRTQYDRYIENPSLGDPFHLDLKSDPTLKALYLDAEAENSYIRDRNVFRPDIDIEDSMAVLVRYHNGAILNYSLTAFCPQEGFRVTLTGDKGQIEFATSYTPVESESITLRALFQAPCTITIPTVKGSHGGADPLLQHSLFGATAGKDALGREAGPEQGAASALIGFAANHSMQSATVIHLNQLLPLGSGAIRLSDLT